MSLTLLWYRHRLFSTLVTITLTFICGGAWILMREALNCGAATPCSVGADAQVQRLEEKGDLRVWTISAVLWSAHAEDAVRSGRSPWERCALFICLLSGPKRVNQQPQWGEGRRKMDIDVKRQRIYFCLCVLASRVSVHLFASWVF